MADPEPKSLKQTLESFFQDIPEILPSYKVGVLQSTVKFIYFPSMESKGIEKTISFYPFQTLRDIKVKVARILSEGGGRRIHPYQLAFLFPLVDEGEDESKQAQDYALFDAVWTISSASGKTTQLTLRNPFLRARGTPDPNFIASTGQKRANGLSDHSRMLFEEAVTMRTLSQIKTIHIFAVQDILSVLSTPRPYSEAEWFGKIHPYFPFLLPEQSGGITAEQEEEGEVFARYEVLSESLLQQYDALLEKYKDEYTKKEFNPYRLRLGGIKYLRLKWSSPSEEKGRTPDILFYELPVNYVRPFLRILPAEGTPVTKLLIEPNTILKKPVLADPKLLSIWSSEKNPTPDKDFLMMKTVIRESQQGLVPAFYGSMRIYNDKTADYVIQAPRNIRRFDVKSDLAELPTLLSLAVKDTPYGTMLPTLEKASLLCGIRLPASAPQIRKEELRARVQAMSYFFQEIIPLPGAPPFLSLRYKAVSNFISQDRINTFLKQLTDRFLQEGRPDSDVIEYLMREFSIGREEAISRYMKYREKGTEILIVDPEAKEYVETYNYGIDIAIYAQHPFYSFHIYGVHSEIMYRRLITSLYLLFSTKASDWTTAKQVEPGFAQVAETVQAEELAAPAETKPTAVEAEEAVAGDVNLGNLGADGMNIGLADLMFESGFEEGNALNANASVNPDAPNISRVASEKQPRQNLSRLLDEPARPQLLGKEAPKVEPTVPVAPQGKKAPAIERTELPTNFAQYFLERLQQSDRALFEYPAAPGRAQYATRCQANVTRQPVVMSQEQFEVMLEKYGAPRRQQFVRIGYDPATNEPFPDTPPETGEYVTCIFYGSDINRSHYYLCPHYFCVHDYIVVFESDFESTIDAYGNSKPPNTCYFCHGKPIQNEKRRGPGETVFVRTIRPQSAPPKRHLWIGWLRDKNAHPTPGLRVPCCFTQNYDVKPTDQAFELYRQKKKVGLPQEERKGLPAPVGAIPGAQPFLDYRITLDKIDGKYILGPEKIPLLIGNQTGPQIGLLPKVLDTFFSQSPGDIVSRDFTRMTLIPNAYGFLRIAVENRQLNSKEGFLAALAPYLNENNLEGVRQKLDDDQSITPRIFVNLNYGNLVIEFYDPMYPWEDQKDLETLETIENSILKEQARRRLFETKLREFATNFLDVDYDSNEVYVKRIYLSWKKFKSFLNDPSQVKEYRHFAHLLSSKLPLTNNRGLLFMILEVKEDNSMAVRCPPFGYDPEKHDTCDIGILMHHWTGVWEPIFFVQKSSTYNPDFPLPPPILKFQQADAPLYWPEVLRVRVEEFRGRCEASGKSIYTSQRGISSDVLFRPSELIEKMSTTPYKLEGYVKDAYNHTVALTFGIPRKITEDGRTVLDFPTVIPVPVVDDGNFSYYMKKLHLDWRDFPRASADKVYAFYTKVLQPAFPTVDGYTIARKIVRQSDNQILAFQLQNGIPIPVETDIPLKKEKLEALSAVPFTLVTSLEYEWDINREIFFSNKEENARIQDSEERLFHAEQQDLEEVYQHLRYTFANWLAGESSPSDFRESLSDLMKRSDLPLFEKRQRLYISLAPEIESWLSSRYATKDETYERPTLTTLLRVDCRMIDSQDSCSGRCKWRTDADMETKGRCLIHNPRVTKVGGHLVNVQRLFVYRLIEELLRFPEKQKQLLENKVSGLIAIENAILIGKTQYIVPEDTPAWYDLLRMDWLTSGLDKPRFFEEISKAKTDVPTAANIGRLTLPKV